LLNLSGKIDQDTVQLLGIVNQIATEIGVPYLIVGATARDLVMHYGYGARIQRATKDLDFAIQIASWGAFTEIKERLADGGFKKTKSPQRMISPIGMPVDLVPFGAIADENSNIQWPPSGDFEMSVLGFDEAHATAMQVIVQQNPSIQVPVATPQGLVLLKLIAWGDREGNLRAKDAKDIGYLLETYQEIGTVTTRVYEEENIAEQYGWDIDLASAHMLGMDTAAIAHQDTKRQVDRILEDNLHQVEPNYLVEEMCSRIEVEYENKLKRLEAFSNGFRN
jgi:predicted nucleotidyltransferase